MELARIQKISISFVSSFALRCAVDLDISGLIQAYGRPMPLNELARSIPIPPEKDSMLHRLMALLVHQGIFMKSEAGYQLTPVSENLLAEGSGLGTYVCFLTNMELLKCWGKMSEVFKDTNRCTLFEKAYDGKQAWDIFKEIPEYGSDISLS